MTWYAWVLIFDLAAAGVFKVSQIDKPRERITHGQAIGSLVEVGLLMWAVFALAAR